MVKEEIVCHNLVNGNTSAQSQTSRSTRKPSPSHTSPSLRRLTLPLFDAYLFLSSTPTSSSLRRLRSPPLYHTITYCPRSESWIRSWIFNEPVPVGLRCCEWPSVNPQSPTTSQNSRALASMDIYPLHTSLRQFQAFSYLLNDSTASTDSGLAVSDIGGVGIYSTLR